MKVSFQAPHGAVWKILMNVFSRSSPLRAVRSTVFVQSSVIVPLGPIGSSSSQHTRTPEIVL